MMGALMRQVSRLMPEIDANDTYLLKMQDNLFLLQELLSSERSSIAAAKSATLGGFWTKAGGNGKKIRSLEYSLGLLADLKATGEDAAACIIAALRTLKEMKCRVQGIDGRCENALVLLTPAVAPAT